MPQSEALDARKLCQFGKVHLALETHRLVGKSDTKSKEDAANVQHRKVLGCGIDDSSNKESCSGNDHAPLATQPCIQQVRNKSSNSTCANR